MNTLATLMKEKHDLKGRLAYVNRELEALESRERMKKRSNAYLKGSKRVQEIVNKIYRQKVEKIHCFGKHFYYKSQVLKEIIHRLTNLFHDYTKHAILITGESGVGKDLVAKNLHHEAVAGGHARDNFFTENCAALTPHLAMTQLAGYSAGAFTDAKKEGTGWFDQAKNGTLLLEEVGDLDTEIQVRFLRVLEEKAYNRIGDLKKFELNSMVVFTTNVDISECIAKGKIRLDFLWRMDDHIHIPPLRDRREDIEAIVTGLCRQENYPWEFLNDDVLSVLKGHEWPGNGRSLAKTLEAVKRSRDFSAANFSREALKRQLKATFNSVEDKKTAFRALDPEEREILDILSKGGELKRSQIQAHLNGQRQQVGQRPYSKGVITKRLGRLMDKRLVIKHGGGASTRYRAG